MKTPSIFFPLALIAAGVIWLLVSLGRIPSANLWALAHFWPFLLIAAGLGLLLRSFWEPGRVLVDLLVVGAAVLAIVFAPQLGWTGPQWTMGLNWGLGGGQPGSGKVVSETRPVTGLQAIELSYPAEVVIRQGEVESVEIEAEDNLLAQLSTEVLAGKLVLANREANWAQRVHPTQPVKILITVKNLTAIDFSSAGSLRVEKLSTPELQVRLSGAGNLTLEELQTDLLDCRLSGAGEIEANGSAKTLKLVISGMGSFQGAELTSQSVETRLSGAGSAIVRANLQLDASLSGAGSIDYYGDPQVSQTVSGAGRIHKIGE